MVIFGLSRANYPYTILKLLIFETGVVPFWVVVMWVVHYQQQSGKAVMAAEKFYSQNKFVS